MDGKHRRDHPRVEETMTATIGLVLDCADPDRLATFWSEALGYTTVGGAGNYVMLVAADGALPKLLLQAVPEPKTTKNRMHLDIEIADVEAEASRLEAIGARRLEPGVRSEHGTNWVIMADPEETSSASATAAPPDPLTTPSRKS
jgi:predicted enzyme related to lactoylglutathione lyase